MKYNSNLPDDSVNIPKENFFLQMVKLFVSLLLLSFLVYGLLKIVLYFVVENLPPSYEKKLTTLVAIDMDSDNLKSSDYLDEITQKVSACAKLPYEIKTFIMPDDALNAFALPGGTIYITRGMLKSLRNQNELVSIIGHEMGHFKNRDHLKGFGTKLLFSLLTLSLGEGYGTILNTTLDITNIKYSQSAELASDAFALDVMQCAYGNVSDATTLFQRLDDGDEWRYFFTTHPAFNKRLEKMQERIARKGYNTEAATIPLKEQF